MIFSIGIPIGILYTYRWIKKENLIKKCRLLALIPSTIDILLMMLFIHTDFQENRL
jgi:hypothetical protein